MCNLCIAGYIITIECHNVYGLYNYGLYMLTSICTCSMEYRLGLLADMLVYLYSVACV